MELYLQNTAHGLIPVYDDDFDEKRKLKIGETYKTIIKPARNVRFHRKYFALINCTWAYQSEKGVELFKTVNGFRKTIEIAAGHCEPVYSIERKEFVDVSKSISFEKMDNAEFQELYDRVKDVIYKMFLRHVTVEEFEKNLTNFL